MPHVVLNAYISISNRYNCAIMHDCVIVLIYNLRMTLFFFIFCSINCLQDWVLVKISLIYWLKKWAKARKN